MPAAERRISSVKFKPRVRRNRLQMQRAEMSDGIQISK